MYERHYGPKPNPAPESFIPTTARRYLNDVSFNQPVNLPTYILKNVCAYRCISRALTRLIRCISKFGGWKKAGAHTNAARANQPFNFACIGLYHRILARSCFRAVFQILERTALTPKPTLPGLSLVQRRRQETSQNLSTAFDPTKICESRSDSLNENHALTIDSSMSSHFQRRNLHFLSLSMYRIDPYIPHPR
jgi:hypothetical protein